MAKVDIVHVPYKGGSLALVDLMAGQVQLVWSPPQTGMPYARSGKLRAIAVSSKERNPLYPDTPTVAESGYKGFEATSWSGVSVAKGTPPAIVDKLEAGLAQAMKSESFKQRLTSVGFVVPPSGSKHYTAFLKSELDQWTRVIKTAGIKPE